MTVPKKKEHKKRTVLSLYLDEIGKHDKLTPREEVELAKMIEAGKNAEKEFFEKKDVLLAPDKETELLAIIEAGKKAKKEFALANLRLVVSIAKKYVGKSLNLTLFGLIQEGNLGLLHAVEGFDWKRGNKFITYATPCIRGTIRRALYGDNERLAVSLDAHNSSDGMSLYDCTEEKRDVSPGDSIDKDLIRHIIQEVLLRQLNQKEREIISLRFGLRDGIMHSLEKTGELLDTARETVRQVEGKALAKLKRYCKKNERLRNLGH